MLIAMFALVVVVLLETSVILGLMIYLWTTLPDDEDYGDVPAERFSAYSKNESEVNIYTAFRCYPSRWGGFSEKPNPFGLGVVTRYIKSVVQ
jgi:hypothetical protein